MDPNPTHEICYKRLWISIQLMKFVIVTSHWDEQLGHHRGACVIEPLKPKSLHSFLPHSFSWKYSNSFSGKDKKRIVNERTEKWVYLNEANERNLDVEDDGKLYHEKMLNLFIDSISHKDQV